MDRAARYQVRVRVQGELPAAWSTVFAGLSVTAEPAGTTLLAGELPDQAAVHGLLGAVRDLGLSMLAVEVISGEPSHSTPDVP